jgi:toxin ParE1/3/4
MSYQLTNEAAQDLEAILLDGMSRFGIPVAIDYHQKLFQVFSLLAQFPEMSRERVELTPAVRIHPVVSHIIIYQLQANQDILIVRVRHAHEDWLSNSI